MRSIQSLLSARRRARSGFTLIELLVVVVIIGILASIAMPSFVSAQDKARNAKALGGLNVVRMALEDFASDHNGNPPTLAEAVGKTNVDEDNFMKANYLPGNKLPASPWATERQKRPIVTIDAFKNLPDAARVDDGETLPKAGDRFEPLLEGAISDPPTLINNYGAVTYDVSPNGGNYVLYVTGKRNAEAIISGAYSRNGS